MKALVLLALGVIGCVLAEREKFEPSPPTGAQLSKWHEIYEWRNPLYWDYHDKKLDMMCQKVEGRSISKASPHVRDVMECCAMMRRGDRRKCFQALQTSSFDTACRRTDHRDTECCQKQSESRYSCFHLDPPSSRVSHKFNSNFEVEREGAEGDPAPFKLGTIIVNGVLGSAEEGRSSGSSESSSSSSEESVPRQEGAAPEKKDQRTQQGLRSSKSSSSSSSSQQSEEGESASSSESKEGSSKSSSSESEEEEGEFGAWLGSNSYLEPACLASDPFPESQTQLRNTSATDICQKGTAPQCSCCCKVGAKYGKQLKKGCPYLQCRQFFKAFYQAHKKCIRHPWSCGFFFIKCCERQHYKGLYGGGQDSESREFL